MHTVSNLSLDNKENDDCVIQSSDSNTNMGKIVFEDGSCVWFRHGVICNSNSNDYFFYSNSNSNSNRRL